MRAPEGAGQGHGGLSAEAPQGPSFLTLALHPLEEKANSASYVAF